MSAELQIILALFALFGPALGAWGGVRFYFGRISAQMESVKETLDDHDERIKFLERRAPVE